MMLKCPAVTIVDVAWVKILLPKYVTTLQVFLIVHFMFPYPYFFLKIVIIIVNIFLNIFFLSQFSMKATIEGFGKAKSLCANQLKYSNNKLHTSSYGTLPFSLSLLVLV